MTVLILPTDAPSVAGPPQGHWNHELWETLPNDGNRYEVIDGGLYMSTVPSAFHQWIILLEAYARASLPEYVIIDPGARTLQHYRLVPAGGYGDPRTYEGGDLVRFDCLPTIEFRVGDLFADAPDTTL